MKNFWASLKRPIGVLAPMADVTDPAYREIIARCGKPDVTYTEFVSADGLYHTRETQKIPDAENPLMKDLQYSDIEHPIVAQVFTSKPEMMEYVANLVVTLGFDGLDINMGCPHAAIERQGAGSALIKNPELARMLIRSAKKGAKGKIPVSVKTRIGYNANTLVPWLTEIFAEEPDALILHARTRKEMSNVPARWEHVQEAVALRDSLFGTNTIPVIGNGDVQTAEEGRKKAVDAGADGYMVGRGMFGNPWFFSGKAPTIEEKLTVLLEHCRVFERMCGHKSFAVMKKHFKAYVTGFIGAKELRIALFDCETVDEIAVIIENFLQSRV
jgi:nifR3 family TIM-barrel protein